MPSFPRSVVGRILESDILDDSVGYKYPTYGLRSELNFRNYYEISGAG